MQINIIIQEIQEEYDWLSKKNSGRTQKSNKLEWGGPGLDLHYLKNNCDGIPCFRVLKNLP